MRNLRHVTQVSNENVAYMHMHSVPQTIFISLIGWIYMWGLTGDCDVTFVTNTAIPSSDPPYGVQEQVSIWTTIILVGVVIHADKNLYGVVKRHRTVVWYKIVNVTSAKISFSPAFSSHRKIGTGRQAPHIIWYRVVYVTSAKIAVSHLDDESVPPSVVRLHSDKQ